MNFTHYILTRYNVGLYSDNPYNIENPDEWMEERFKRFKETFNSVMMQSVHYTWLIFVDEKTPYKYILEIESLPRFGYFYNVQIISGNYTDYDFNNVYEYTLTTRLDNDDILEPDFVETVQAQFCGREGVIDVEGRQFDTAAGKYYTVDRRYPNSPFITLVEKGANPKTVFHKTHTDLHKDYKWSAYVKGKPLYTQVIHGNNLANKITGKEI